MSETTGERIAAQVRKFAPWGLPLAELIDAAIAKERQRAEGLIGALEIISCTQRFAQQEVILGQMMRAPDANDCRNIARQAIAAYDQSGEGKGE